MKQVRRTVMMRMSDGLFLGIVGVVMAVGLGRAQTETITGKVVDLFCYDPKTGANSGMDHKAIGAAGQEGRECATSCARWEGQPVGLLTSDGKIYQLAGGLVANNNAKIWPHMTETVTITGDIAEEHGISMLTASDLKVVSK
jgi:hypothetical protein